MYCFEQRLNVISQVSPHFFLNAPGFQSVGAKIGPKKYVNFLPWLYGDDCEEPNPVQYVMLTSKV